MRLEMRDLKKNIRKVENLTGGINTPLNLITLVNNRKIVAKQYGFETDNHTLKLHRNIGKKIKADLLELRNLYLENFLKIPKLLGIRIISDKLTYKEALENLDCLDSEEKYIRLLIIEEYTGISAKQLILNNKLTDKIVGSIRDYIFALPENIVMDSKPSNFTVRRNKIYFVDFIAPKIEEYQKDPELVKIFPYLKRRPPEREARRLRRYLTPKGRWERFKYYASKLETN